MDGAFHLFHSAQACVSERWKGVGGAMQRNAGRERGARLAARVVVVSDSGGDEGVGATG